MSRDPSRIFLSAASGDYELVRRNLANALDRGGCHIIHQDAFPQTASDTLLKLAQLVDRCGVTVHIIGRQPGSIPRPEIRAQYLASADAGGEFLATRPALRAALGDFSTITYTQWEAYIALHLGMPLFVYVDPSHADSHHAQRDHIDRLKASGRYPESYVDEADLYRLAMADLMAHFLFHPATRGMAARIQPSNLPGGYIGRLFLGRDEFLEDIRASLHGTGRATAITQQATATGISGLGGIGKTHAAVEYAHRHRADYSALLFATADSPERLQSCLAALCGVLHLDENGSLPPEQPTRVAAVLDWLAAHPGWLLIVDNVDDEAAALALTTLLGRLTAGHVLITSRLHGWSDQVKNIDLDVLSDEAAAELLLQLTADRRRLAPDDEAQALELAMLLEGLPLAVHQAAGFINERTRTLAAYHADYQREAASLLDWFNDLAIPYERPDKLAPRPVLITWKTSFDQLADDEKFWLLVFSHFAPEPIPEFLIEPAEDAAPEVRAMLDQAATAIARAEKFCLLSRSRSEPFFKLHRIVQQIMRLKARVDERNFAIEGALALIAFADAGDALDVSSWAKWNSLQPHAVAICDYASDDFAPLGLSDLLVTLGLLFKGKALFSDAERFYRRALRIDREYHGDDHPKVAVDLNNLAQLLHENHRLSEAEPMMRDSLRIDRIVHGDDHPLVAIRLSNLARLLLDTNRIEEAEPMMWEALRIDRATYGDDHPTVAVNLCNLAGLLKATQRFEEAEAMMREALRIDLAALGEGHPMVALHLSNLARLLHDTHRLAEAEPLMREALRVHLATYGGDHPMVATRLSNLAGLLLFTGREFEAESLMRDALRIDRAAYGADHPKVARGLNNLAHLLQATSRQAEAEPLMRDALRILHASLGPEHPYTQGIARSLEILLAEIAATSVAVAPSPASADGTE